MPSKLNNSQSIFTSKIVKPEDHVDFVKKGPLKDLPERGENSLRDDYGDINGT